MRILALVFIAIIGFGQTVPAPVTTDQEIEVQKLTIRAHQALQQVTLAQKRQVEAKLDEIAAQKVLDDLNSKIVEKMAEIRRLCRADEKKWDINDSYQWVERKK